MWNNVYVPTSHVASQNRYRDHQFFASTQGFGRRTSLHIEICMRIDEFKSNRYVGPKIRPI